MKNNKTISVVIPIYNEEKNIPLISEAIRKEFQKINYNYELILVNDGSKDKSEEVLNKIKNNNQNIKVINLSRNFGKEIAITAGLNSVSGNACIMVDADMQHPPELIHEFINKWEKGADVVIGVREENKGEGSVKKIGSYFYNKVINKINSTPTIPGSTDFRLIDRQVIDAFNTFTEKNRITRGLIDWLGFKREYIYFKANERANGVASYNFPKLVKLTLNSIVSLSLFPLKIVGYLGVIICLLSGLLGLFIIFEKYIFRDSLNLHISGTAILADIIIFLVGIILISLGLITLYIANIHEESIKRPLYIIRKDR